jgi:molybdenum cofactor cytidylyltransferase
VSGDARIEGLVLAAGAASRFGAPKQLAELDGRPQVTRAAEAQRDAAGVERVAVVTGAYAEEVGEAVPEGVDTVVCLGWDEGMAASLRAGLAALADADWIVVSLADQPGVTSEIVAEIAAAVAAEAASDDEADAVRATYDGVPQHPVALGPALLAQAEELEGDAGFRDLLQGARVRLVEVGHLGSAVDVDTPDDLRSLS